ncbi:septum formation initiator [Cryptosporangium minutisporangium]|uniref:Septum formation initiator n=1 Tax=Cryptosporangium minutisporangium TaxID=113569 RepID=A0ABP6T0B2_9ACTN
MSSSRAGLRSRPGAVREGRPLQTKSARSGRSAANAAQPAGGRRRQAAPISVPPSPSVPSRTVTASSRAPFVVLVLALAIGGLIGLVLLNTAVNENAFRLHDLETRQEKLDEEEQRLQQALENQESPEKLAKRAQELDLVPAGDPGFVVLPEGKVVGTPVPATPPPSPTPSASASSGSSASPSPSAGR